MDAARLLCHTLSDLDERIASRDEYQVLMSSALLRKLLMDGQPLVDQVNRTFKLKIRFRMSAVSPFEQQVLTMKPVFYSIEDALDPESKLAYAPYDATRDQFLGRMIMYVSGQSITVRDVIDQLANVEGGVHSGHPKELREEIIRAAGQFFSRDGLSGIVSQLRLIGRISSRGLSPLRDAVLAQAEQNARTKATRTRPTPPQSPSITGEVLASTSTNYVDR